MGQSALKSFDFEKFCGVVEVITSEETGVFTEERLHELGAQFLEERQERIRQSSGEVGVSTEFEAA